MWFLFLALLAQSANVFDDGNKALDAKQYDRAIELFTQAAAADPKDYTAHFQLALTYSLLGRDREAIPQYQTTLELHPGLYEAELNLGLSLMRTNDPAGAIPHFTAASGQKPKEFRPALGLAQALLNTSHFAEAETSYRTAAALDPRSAAAESGLAMSLIRQKRADDAAPHVQQAFVLDRSYRAGFVALAELYESAGRTAEAITFYRMFPDNPEALERLGVLLTAKGDTAEAIQALEALMEKMPTDARRIELAQAYAQNKQIEKAQATIQPALQASPNDFDLRMFYGKLLRDQRKFANAAEQFSAADQLRVFKHAMRFPVFRQIVSMPSVTLPVAGTLTNFNPVLAEGYAGKTGSDSAAGGCLAFFTHVTSGGRRLTVVGVVLGQGEGSDTTEILAAAGQAAEQLVDAAHNAITTSRSTHE
jgi:Tfp pilus assembly protein PilF